MLDKSTTATDLRVPAYRLLARLFARELSEADIEDLRCGHGQDLLIILQEDQTAEPFATRLAAHFREIENIRAARLDLAESYAWLFHGVAGPNSAPLYASVYTDRSGATHRAIERAFLTLLSDHGLSPENQASEPCDHLAALLEFVSWLSETDTLSPDDRRSRQEAFITDYLLSWLPLFSRQCRIGDPTGFYAELAEDTLRFVTADHLRISATRP